MARVSTTKGYAEDLRRAARPIKKAMTQARVLGHDPEWMRAAREVAAENNQRVFGSSGAAIAERWDGVDYVETGRMRRELVTPGLLRSRVYANRILLNARVKYVKYHARKIIGWTARSSKRLAMITARHLKRIGEGKA